MNLGKLAVSGAPRDLKRTVGGDVLTVSLSGNVPNSLPADLGSVVSSEQGTVKILTVDGERAIPRITNYFEQNGVVVESVSLSRPTLEDVFMKYAKTSLQQEGTFREARSARRTIARHGR
jgi:ABC-2 type transport system ATP-binding protein